jgi:hypothetical protein
MRACPAHTQAPEKILAKELNRLNNVSNAELGISLLKYHEIIPILLKTVHRFRAINKTGLYGLAKDIARLTADCINSSAIQKFLTIPKGERLGSLKSLEYLIALNIGSQKARLLLAPLVGAYELRHGDAHLPSGQIDEAFALARVDKGALSVYQGYQLLDACVSSICSIVEALKGIGQKVGE